MERKVLGLNSIVQRRNEVIAANAGTDLVMVSVESGSYFSVSEVGRAIWEQLETPHTVAELVDHLHTNYEIDRASCEEQTLSFLQTLANEQLLTISDETST